MGGESRTWRHHKSREVKYKTTSREEKITEHGYEERKREENTVQRQL